MVMPSGNVGLITVSILSFTFSTISTVFSPRIFVTPMPMAGFPLNRATFLKSDTSSTILAISCNLMDLL